MSFNEFLAHHAETRTPVFFDGGMGTMIQASGVTDYHVPEELNITHADVIADIHRQYAEAGADIITTNTFGATPIKLKGAKCSPKETIAAAVANARKGIADAGKTGLCFVAFDIGPTGYLLEPSGTLPFEDAVSAFAAAAKAGEAAGADLAIIETMSDLYETKAAILAVKENTNLPIIATVTFQDSRRMLSGADVASAVTTLESLGVSAIGLNCGVSLADAAALTEEFLSYASVPVIVQPNAGLPVVENGRTVFKVTPEEFGRAQAENFKKGALILGGCCGTTPAHIAAVKAELGDGSLVTQTQREPGDGSLVHRTFVSSGTTAVQIGDEAGAVIIGERINPTGKKKCKAALLEGDMQFVLNEAESQLNAGASILDVNVGLPGIDETAVMTQVVKLLQKTFLCPLQIDSSEPAVLESAMRAYNGKPLVNSVNGKQAVMDAVFPLVKKYGGAVVALCLDESGIPPTAEGRLAIAKKIVAEAATYGIKKSDIVLDMLTLTVSSQQKEAAETLRGIQLIKADPELAGVKTVLGVSNISFGLPRRDIVNSHFFSMALNAGLDACIINPLSAPMMEAYDTYRIIYAKDENCMQFIDKYANTVAPTAGAGTQALNAAGASSANAAAGSASSAAAASESSSAGSALMACIMKGYADQAAKETEALLKTCAPMDIVNNHIVPALDAVGKDYAAGKKFLPQLLLSADTVSNAFAVLKAALASSGVKQEVKGRIIMATVQGDIHDIGKNIVVAMLENYGYEVLNLGKDVAPERIIETALKENISVIGLSALMTTTVLSMEKTIALLRETEAKQAAAGKPVKFTVMVGGAVLTPEYAKKIGADYYGKDAMDTVNAAKQIFA
ncbi:MAG: homocysteine S-methyltransferase family protein [Treponema sp.]|nr:homocysteine S-methyltransferase family protein [Candidatus Treponema caballi]